MMHEKHPLGREWRPLCWCWQQKSGLKRFKEYHHNFLVLVMNCVGLYSNNQVQGRAAKSTLQPCFGKLLFISQQIKSLVLMALE